MFVRRIDITKRKYPEIDTVEIPIVWAAGRRSRVTAEDAARYVIVVDGLDQHALGLQVLGERVGADQPLFFTGVDGKDNRISKGILAHDAGQLEDHGRPGGVVPDAGRTAGGIAVVVVSAIHMRFNNDQRFIGRLASGQDREHVVMRLDGRALGAGIGGRIIGELQIADLESAATCLAVFDKFIIDPSAGSADPESRGTGVGKHIPVLKTIKRIESGG